jgi:hypothetical protein
MKRLEVSGVVRPLYGLLGVRGLIFVVLRGYASLAHSLKKNSEFTSQPRGRLSCYPFWGLRVWNLDCRQAILTLSMTRLINAVSCYNNLNYDYATHRTEDKGKISFSSKLLDRPQLALQISLLFPIPSVSVKPNTSSINRIFKWKNKTIRHWEM